MAAKVLKIGLGHVRKCDTGLVAGVAIQREAETLWIASGLWLSQ
jgi:hypothetical protein